MGESSGHPARGLPSLLVLEGSLRHVWLGSGVRGWASRQAAWLQFGPEHLCPPSAAAWVGQASGGLAMTVSIPSPPAGVPGQRVLSRLQISLL